MTSLPVVPEVLQAMRGVGLQQFQNHKANRPAFRLHAGFHLAPQVRVNGSQGVFLHGRISSTAPIADHLALTMPSPDPLRRAA